MDLSALLFARRTCALCDESVPIAGLLAHTARCLIEVSIKLKQEPFCTCPPCDGTRTHPGSSRLRRAADSQQQAPPMPALQAQDTIEQLLSEVNEETEPSFSTVQISGRSCFICNSGTTPRKNFPVMRIGSYYGARPCCKKHHNPTQRAAGVKALDNFARMPRLGVRPDDCSTFRLYDDGSPNRALSPNELATCPGTEVGRLVVPPSHQPLLATWNPPAKCFHAFCSINV